MIKENLASYFPAVV